MSGFRENEKEDNFVVGGFWLNSRMKNDRVLIFLIIYYYPTFLGA